MGSRRLLLASALTALVVGLAGCAGTEPDPSADPAPSTPTVTVAVTPTPTPSAPPAAMPLGPDGRPFVVQEVTQFGAPWAMAFLPGTEQALVTERTGRLHLLDTTTGQHTEVSGVPRPVVGGQGGLGDVMPSPTYADDGLVYLSWVEPGEGGSGAVVGRARLVLDGSPRLDGLETIWRQVPKTSGSGHFSHRLAFSPDGRYLFVSSGDRQKFDPAQDLANNLGSIVRLDLDGQPAGGNPFADRGGVTAEIWSYGHRNVLGLAFAPDGVLWNSEMGPRGGDEVNLIEPGANYGWPEASNGSHYSGGNIPDHAAGDGFVAPQVWWTPSISPGSLMIYSGDLFPGWQGDALLGALSGQALVRVDIEGATATKAEQWDMGERIREVEQGPDGAVWLLEDEGSGRVLRLTPPA